MAGPGGESDGRAACGGHRLPLPSACATPETAEPKSCIATTSSASIAVPSTMSMAYEVLVAYESSAIGIAAISSLRPLSTIAHAPSRAGGFAGGGVEGSSASGATG